MRVVIAGNGMVGHQLVTQLRERGAGIEIVVIGEEPRGAYDRVHLTSLFGGATDLALPTVEGAALHLDERVTGIDRATRVVRTGRGREFSYDKLVLATGSYPFVP